MSSRLACVVYIGVKINNKQKAHSGVKCNRRELLKKYGAYTAPTVIALALPGGAYGHGTTEAYSSLDACLNDPGSNHMSSGHCRGHHRAG